jgi:hypothetical protein
VSFVLKKTMKGSKRGKYMIEDKIIKLEKKTRENINHMIFPSVANIKSGLDANAVKTNLDPG